MKCAPGKMEIQNFLSKFSERLLDLPVAKKAPHAKCFHKDEDSLIVAKICHPLMIYCNYNNYEILQEVVTKFCEAVLQPRMQEYCESLEKFEKETFIDVYLEVISVDVVLTSEFTKVTVKINKPASKCTLHEVRKLKDRRKSISSVVQCLRLRYLRELSSAGAGIPCQLCGMDNWSLYSRCTTIPNNS